MPQVASVRLRYASQDYWFDPAGIDVKEGDHVLVETSKGTEIGLCTQDVYDVDEAEVVKPLKPVVRIATEEDLEKSEELNEKSQKALSVFGSYVEKHGLDMSPTAVEFSFDGSHATFYFTSDERVDFRNLVRDLASEFHVRVDMRQIGSRDEARMLGGLGHCGEELCCRRLGGEFQPVSIRMAKEQDLPLNPAKISGLCGRLMCCLRYEYEAYKDFKSRAPKKNGIIETPVGIGKVVEFDTPRETVRLRMEDGSSLVLPVDMLDTGDKVAKEGERIRPCHISQINFDKVIEELNADKALAMMGDKLFSDDPELADTTAASGAVERIPRRRRNSAKDSSESGSGAKKRSAASEPKPRDERKRRRSVSASDDGAAKQEPADTAAKTPKGEGSEAARKPRRRRGSSGGSKQAASKRPQKETSSDAPKKPAQEKRPRPGQHSSSLSGTPAREGSASTPAPSANKRRRRRGGRGRGKGGSGSQGSSE